MISVSNVLSFSLGFIRFISRMMTFILILTILCLQQVSAQSSTDAPFHANNITVSGDYKRFAISGRYELPEGSDEGIDHIDVYDAVTLQRLYAISVNPSPALLISLNHDGTKVAYSTRIGNVVIRDLNTGNETVPVGGGYGDVDELAWSPVEDKLASVQRRQINIERDGKRYISMIDAEAIGHTSSIDWSSDGKILASTDYSSSEIKAVLQFWDLSLVSDTVQLLDTPKMRIPDAGGSSLSWDSTNRMIAAKEVDGIHIYDVTTGKEIAYLDSNNSIINGSGPIDWIPDTTQIIGGDNEGIYQWDYVSGAVERLFKTAPITQLVWTPHGILHNGGRELYIDDKTLTDIALTPTP